MQSKWDERYRQSAVDPGRAAAILLEHGDHLASPGVALDLACGLGANAVALSRLGFTVHAWDLSPVAIGKLRDYAAREGLTVEAAVRDVVASPPPPESYDLILVSRFLERALCPAIAAALRPGGLLFYQTFCGPGPGPANPAHRLQPGELPRLFAGLEALVYREESAAGEAQLVARRKLRG